MGIAIKNSKWVFITISHRDFTTTNNKAFTMTSAMRRQGGGQERFRRGVEERQVCVESDGCRHRPRVKTAHGALCGEQARTRPAREPRHRTSRRRTHVLRGGRNLHERE